MATKMRDCCVERCNDGFLSKCISQLRGPRLQLLWALTGAIVIYWYLIQKGLWWLGHTRTHQLKIVGGNSWSAPWLALHQAQWPCWSSLASSGPWLCVHGQWEWSCCGWVDSRTRWLAKFVTRKIKGCKYWLFFHHFGGYRYFSWNACLFQYAATKSERKKKKKRFKTMAVFFSFQCF